MRAFIGDVLIFRYHSLLKLEQAGTDWAETEIELKWCKVKSVRTQILIPVLLDLRRAQKKDLVENIQVNQVAYIT